MGTIEMINLGMSVMGGAGLTMAGNGVNTVLDVFSKLAENAFKNRQQNHDNKVEKFDKTEESTKTAREFKGDPTYHQTRKWIAKVVIGSYFVLPLTMPFIAALIGMPMMISIGYFDLTQGWPWEEAAEVVKWVTIGHENGFPIVITPVMNNSVISIIGMFFGNQMVKK